MRKIERLGAHSGSLVQNKINEIINVINGMNGYSKNAGETKLKTGADIRQALSKVETEEDFQRLLGDLGGKSE